MLFEGSKVVLCHGVVDLRKGAVGLLSLVPEPEPGTWYLFSNRTRQLIKCVRTDRRRSEWRTQIRFAAEIK